MNSFKTFISEMSHKDLHPKYRGISTGELSKRAADNRKHSPSDRAHMKKEIEMRGKVREETGGAAMAGAPGNNTRSGPGMGDDNTLRTRNARLMKGIYRRHGVAPVKKSK